MRCRRSLAFLTVLLAACGGGKDAPVDPPSNAPRTATVTMLPSAFIPFSTTIAVGGTVTFEFPPGIDHNVIFERQTGAPQDIQITRNASVDRKFTTQGTYAYDCRIHPGMIGEVVVVP